MICDRFGVPIEEGQKVVFKWENSLLEGVVNEIKEIVAGTDGVPTRQLIVVTKFTFRVHDQTGPAPNLGYMIVAAGQDAPPKSSLATH